MLYLRHKRSAARVFLRCVAWVLALLKKHTTEGHWSSVNQQTRLHDDFSPFNRKCCICDIRCLQHEFSRCVAWVSLALLENCTTEGHWPSVNQQTRLHDDFLLFNRTCCICDIRGLQCEFFFAVCCLGVGSIEEIHNRRPLVVCESTDTSA